MIRAMKNDTVKVHYTGRLEDGTVFDESPQDRPLQFIVGKHEVIVGFDEAIDGMYQGESKTVTIPCAKAYGESKPEMFETIDRSVIDANVELVVGGQLEVTQQNGNKFYLMITEVTDDKVTLDANHPLADKDLIFEINLLEVTKPQQ